MFNLETVERLSEEDWASVTQQDGSIDISAFLTLVGAKLKITVISEEEFWTTFALVKSIEQLLGPFDRHQAISLAIMYALSK
jgi:hypothetical protein